MKTINLTLIPVLAFIGILGIVILFGHWSQPQPELGGGAIDLDPDLSPSYTLDFGFGFFYTIIPLVSIFVIISALFLIPHFILKRKKIPSRPYMSLILSGLLLQYGITNLISSLVHLQSMLQLIDDGESYMIEHLFVAFWIPVIVLSVAGILLYRSSVIRKLIKK